MVTVGKEKNRVFLHFPAYLFIFLMVVGDEMTCKWGVLARKKQVLGNGLGVRTGLGIGFTS
jgi:hypothetical protein